MRLLGVGVFVLAVQPGIQVPASCVDAECPRPADLPLSRSFPVPFLHQPRHRSQLAGGAEFADHFSSDRWPVFSTNQQRKKRSALSHVLESPEIGTEWQRAAWLESSNKNTVPFLSFEE
jgi:hypothetical protein